MVSRYSTMVKPVEADMFVISPFIHAHMHTSSASSPPTMRRNPHRYFLWVTL